MRHCLTFLFLLLLCGEAPAQSPAAYWKKWNAEYKPQDVPAMLKKEHDYALKVQKDKNVPPYYFRKAKYRFKAKVMGASALIDDDVMNSVNRVYKLTGGNPAILQPLFKKAVLIQVGNQKMWMPIQEKVLDGLKAELQAGDSVTLYCLYLNEHTSKNVLYNNFLICEFRKDI